MSKELNRTFPIGKLAVLAAGFGLLIIGSIDKASAEANCPQWSTPVCQHWNMGPPPSCTEWACAADKKSDPPKVEGITSVGTGNPQPNPTLPPRRIIDPVRIVGGATPVPPGVNTGIVTTVNPGTGTTTATIYARRNFKPLGVHLATANSRTTFTRSVVHNIAYHQPTVSHASANMMVMHASGGGGHGHR